jgi:hypothetical protein
MLSSILTTFTVAFVALMVAFMLINIRQIFTGKDFRGTCAQNNPLLKSKIGNCTVCGKKPEDDCQMPEVHTEK